jgi:hypothetical protein
MPVVCAVFCCLPSTCKEVDTLLLSRGRCYVAVNTDLLFTSYHVQRYHKDKTQQQQEEQDTTGTHGSVSLPCSQLDLSSDACMVMRCSSARTGRARHACMVRQA